MAAATSSNSNLTNNKRKKKGIFECDLAGVEMVDKVVTRFLIEPSKQLHIGHCKALLVNYNCAKRYNGSFNVRIDDTNPNHGTQAIADSLKDDLKLMGIVPNAITFTSDYFGVLETTVENMIRCGLAYADATPVDEMRRQKIERVDSEYRSRSVEANLQAWKEMKIASSDQSLNYVIRAKIDTKSLNGAMRDPVLYRVHTTTPHFKTGATYRVYPVHGFATPIVDSIEGITHVMRSDDFNDHNAQYAWIMKAAGLNAIPIVNFPDINFSKHAIVHHSIKSMFRCGILTDTLQKFIFETNARKHHDLLTMDRLWKTNASMMNHTMPHYRMLKQNTVVLLRLTGKEDMETTTLIIPRSKKNPDLGTTTTYTGKEVFIDGEYAKRLGEGDVLNLVDWENVTVNKIIKDSHNNSITCIEATFNVSAEGIDDQKCKKWNLVWLANVPENLTHFTLVEYDYVIYNTYGVDHIANINFIRETPFLGDRNVRALQTGQLIRLENNKCFRVERLDSESDEIRLISIPKYSDIQCLHCTYRVGI
jgi:glutamyl-tRNA synthetase